RRVQAGRLVPVAAVRCAAGVWGQAAAAEAPFEERVRNVPAPNHPHDQLIHRLLLQKTTTPPRRKGGRASAVPPRFRPNERWNVEAQLQSAHVNAARSGSLASYRKASGSLLD